MKIRVALLAGLGLIFGSAATVPAAQVTFQVNMSAQVSLGNFNPGSDALFVAGDPINGWSTSESPLSPSAGDANIWTGTFEVAGTAGGVGEYKFLFVTSTATTWEGNVGTGGPNGNRTLTLADTDQTLPVVFFNNVTSGSSVSSDTTFQVDMSVQIALGMFDPEAGIVNIAGEFNGWNTSDFELTRSVADPDLWVGTRRLTGASNSTLAYKYLINGGTWEGNVGPDGAQNRACPLPSADPQTLPPVFFNNVSDLGLIALGPLAGDQLTLSWTAAPLVRLQTAPDLPGAAWQEVPNTLGEGTATITVGPGRGYFRLAGP